MLSATPFLSETALVSVGLTGPLQPAVSGLPPQDQSICAVVGAAFCAQTPDAKTLHLFAYRVSG